MQEDGGGIRHILPLCDTPDRLGARLYLALRVECHCCTFYRGVALGATIGATVAALVAAFIP